jgi:hypothetical protein
MALTLQRPVEAEVPDRLRVTRRPGLVALGTGPIGVLAAACLLTTGFLVAVADLVSRLG